jgi:hypothetical protein
MASATDKGHPASAMAHRRETFRYIVLPIIGVGALILVGIIIVLLLPGRLQVSIIADWLLMILFLCPMMLCLFPICILMVAAVAGMNKAHTAAANPLRRLERLSESLKERTVQATDNINHQTINVSTRWAFLERWLKVFDPPSEQSDDVNKEG